MDAFVLSLLLGTSLFIRCQAAPPSKPNVLFLVSDDMRPQLGAYYGPDFPSPIHPKMITPNLDRLAGRSLLLKKAYVQQALCSPSRTSLLTGRRPDTTRTFDLWHYFRDIAGNFTTLPQYFKQHGYTTVGLGKIFHPGHGSGNDDPVSWSKPFWHPSRDYWQKDMQDTWHIAPDEEVAKHPLEDMQVWCADRSVRRYRSGFRYVLCLHLKVHFDTATRLVMSRIHYVDGYLSRKNRVR